MQALTNTASVTTIINAKPAPGVTFVAAGSFADFLKLGGPDAIKGLRATIKKLQAEITQLQQDKQVERYRQLQVSSK